MSKEMLVYGKYTNFVKRLLTIYGLYPHQRSIVRYLPIFVLLSYSLVSCGLVNFFRLHITNISAIAACSSLLSTCLNISVKILRFTFHRKRLVEIYNILARMFEKTAMKQPSGSPVFQYLLPCYRLAYYQFVCMFVTAILYTIRPLIAITFRNAKRSSPIPTKYPWPNVSTASFATHYALEVLVSFSFSIITSGVDAFFTMCAFRICSVFRAMAVELEELPKRSDDVESHGRVLRKCIKRHATLTECQNAIEEIYGPVVLAVTMTNGFGMCMLIFEVFRAEEIPVEKVCALSLYLFGKVIQTLIYAWPGNMITSENEVFRREVYYNNWYERSDIETGKLSLTILSQRLMVLKACNLLVISLDLFAKIMNRTISYYFLLVTLDTDE